MLFCVNRSPKTVSGPIVSLASTGLIVDGHEDPYLTHLLGTASNAVVIDGITLHAEVGAIIISGTTLILVLGPTGLYLPGTVVALSALSVQVSAKESSTMDATERLVEGGGGGGFSESGFEGGGLGSLIMLGFGILGVASASRTTSAAVGDTASVTDFEGTGRRNLDLYIVIALSRESEKSHSLQDSTKILASQR